MNRSYPKLKRTIKMESNERMKEEPTRHLPMLETVIQSAKAGALPDPGRTTSDGKLGDDVVRALRQTKAGPEYDDWAKLFICLGRRFALGACVLALLAGILAPGLGEVPSEPANSLSLLGEW